MVDWLEETIKMDCAVAQAHGILSTAQIEKCEEWDAIAMRRHEAGHALKTWELVGAADARIDALMSDGLIEPDGNGAFEPRTASEAARTMWSGTLNYYGLDGVETTPEAVAERALKNAIDNAKYDINRARARATVVAQNVTGFAAMISLMRGMH